MALPTHNQHARPSTAMRGACRGSPGSAGKRGRAFDILACLASSRIPFHDIHCLHFACSSCHTMKPTTALLFLAASACAAEPERRDATTSGYNKASLSSALCVLCSYDDFFPNDKLTDTTLINPEPTSTQAPQHPPTSTPSPPPPKTSSPRSSPSSPSPSSGNSSTRSPAAPSPASSAPARPRLGTRVCPPT